jgi:hypothetical protein
MKSNLRVALITTSLLGCLAISGCVTQDKELQATTSAPVNCATAQGDLKVLRAEKADVAKQIAAGFSAVFPIGLVANLIAGTEGTQYKIAVGEYNKLIDQKVAEIQQKCGI